MESASLLSPRTGGRSRFSKALPMPPGIQNQPQTVPSSPISKGLPEIPGMTSSTVFPPRKDSVGVKILPNPIDSPLPALPVTSPAPEIQKKMPPIPRKAVASPTSVLTVPSETQTPMALKRTSSISSLLSAYSNTSADSVQRSSQGSSVTKSSEASLSPEREELYDGKRDQFASIYGAYSDSPLDERFAIENEVEMTEPLPPPPPAKNVSRPITPRVGLPSNPRGGKAAGPAPPTTDEDATAGTIPLLNATPPPRELWRRRASSKSDRSLAVAGLKLSVSHGSTAATSAPLAAPDQLPIPKPINPAGDASNKSPQPPKSTSGLPGRNIRPQPLQANGASERQNETASVKILPPVPGANVEEKSQDKVMLAEATPKLPPKDSPTIKLSPSNASTIRAEPRSGEKPASPKKAVNPPLSSPDPQRASGNSLRRRDIGAPAVGSGPRPQASMETLRVSSASNNEARLRAAKSNFELSAQSHATNSMAIPTPNLPTRTPGSLSRRPPTANSQYHAYQPQHARSSPDPTVYRDINTDPVELDSEQQEKLDKAIRMAQRSPTELKSNPTEDGVWPALELSKHHYNCLAQHKKWHITHNKNYPIQCMVCHLADKNSRCVCMNCGVRVCQGCAGTLKGANLQDVDVKSLRAGR